MNQSERLHNPRNTEQIITPELKLSMELRTKCEQLLQEKGRNTIDVPDLVLQLIPPIGIIRSLMTKNMPQDLVRRREVRLIPQKAEAYMCGLLSVFIQCKGRDPSKAKLIDVHIPIMGGSEPIQTKYLQLGRQQRGRIANVYPKTYDYPDRANLGGVRLATMEELETYQRYINQSSSIEHK